MKSSVNTATKTNKQTEGKQAIKAHQRNAGKSKHGPIINDGREDEQLYAEVLFHLTEPDRPKTIHLPVTLTGLEWAQLAQAAQRESACEDCEDKAEAMGEALVVAATTNTTLEEYAKRA